MNDQIPADKVREILDTPGLWAIDMIAKIEALLPAPPRPTLADMTREERDGCRWMQADAGQLGRVVIVTPDKTDNLAALLDRQGNVAYGGHDTVTPRPDLPRLEWPDDQKADDVPPVKVGDVIESADDPRLAALPAGTVLRDLDGEEVTRSEGGPGTWRGAGYIPIPSQGNEFGPWTVRRIGLVADQ